jgi:hypothetical protein
MTVTSTYVLRFPNYDAARLAAISLGFWDEENDMLRSDGQSIDAATGERFGWSIVLCGQDPIIQPAQYNSSGVEIAPAVRASGYYVNLIGQLPPAAMSFIAPEPYGTVPPIIAGTL